MKITGHKTKAAFRRYHTIDDRDLMAAQRQMDTYLDTTASAIAYPALEAPPIAGEILAEWRR